MCQKYVAEEVEVAEKTTLEKAVEAIRAAVATVEASDREELSSELDVINAEVALSIPDDSFNPCGSSAN